ncbi:MAG: hypothetical protein JW870_15415 [Candidatus Delongbacteria bacterium]|nr:hypothetical protein [Candidatus Delongbacteria bacterium]
MRRCTRCIMPYCYPGIEFDDEGICNFCRNYKNIEYLGAEELKREILASGKIRENSKYSCAVGFSGGRDSTYLLYFLSVVLKLKVIAFNIDNGYLPSVTQDNIKNITKLLNIDLVIKKFPYLEKCFHNHLKAWLHKPSAAMISALCIGCRLGLEKGIYELVQEYDIPVYIEGDTPFEGNQYKTNLIRISENSRTKSSLVLGYLSQVSKNIRWISNPYCIFTQTNEYLAFYGLWYTKKLKRKGRSKISPFHKYIRWEEEKIIDVLENKLGWKRNKKTGSTWRGDCDIALLKLYLYKELLGYNDKDDSLSDLIRDGQISREKALNRLEGEQFISERLIRYIVEKNNIDFCYFQEIINNIKEKILVN